MSQIGNLQRVDYRVTAGTGEGRSAEGRHAAAAITETEKLGRQTNVMRENARPLTRNSWLAERRKLARERFDRIWAPTYDRHWGEIARTHRTMLRRFLDTCVPGGRILDAGCGTGKYWGLVLLSGRTLLGVDQSEAMLEKAKEKYPEVPVVRRVLQEVNYRSEYDGVICIDVMETILPEDWPKSSATSGKRSKTMVRYT